MKKFLSLTGFRYLAPLVMVPLFLLAFLRVELRWQKCDPCFHFPAYPGYEQAQAVDLHTLFLLPAAFAGLEPDSIDCCYYGKRRPQWPRYLAVAASVGVCWWLTGLWLDRLKSGRRLPPGRSVRRVVVWGAFVFLGILLVGMTRAIRGGWHGPTATPAALLLPLTLMAMAAVELGLTLRAVGKLPVRIVFATLLTALCFWAKTAADAERFSTDVQPVLISPPLLDAILLQAPVLVVTEPVLNLLPTRIARVYGAATLRYPAVWCWWFLLASLTAGKWPAQSARYLTVRKVLRGVLSIALFLSGLSWMAAQHAHGPVGAFGAALGLAFAVFALRQPHPDLNR